MSALRSLSSPVLLRTEMTAVATVALMLGLVVALAPAQVIVTAGSRPIIDVWPDALTLTQSRVAWGVCWCLAAFAMVALSWRPTHLWMQIVVWSTAGTSGIWSAGSLWFAVQGRGSAIGAVVFTFPLLWVGFLLIRVVKSSGAKCGGS